MNNTLHTPVLLSEAIDVLSIKQHGVYVDATFGRGGHTQAMLEKGATVIAIDQDEDAIAYGYTKFLKDIEQKRLILVKENFEYLDRIDALSNKKIDGILYDFGVSSVQFDDASRGFSFQEDAVLDMRMDKSLAVTAKDLVNGLSKELMYLLEKFSQESRAHAIADAIVKARVEKPISTTKQLAQLIERVYGHVHGHLHPATKTFMALRMAINDELGSIERSLPKALDLLHSSSRIVTISFHEGEDRIVKTYMKDWQAQGKGQMLTKKPITPSNEEVSKNVRSRSAKLRIFEKGN